jgi:hypothetical protein
MVTWLHWIRLVVRENIMEGVRGTAKLPTSWMPRSKEQERKSWDHNISFKCMSSLT